jgi:hypothetical protein
MTLSVHNFKQNPDASLPSSPLHNQDGEIGVVLKICRAVRQLETDPFFGTFIASKQTHEPCRRRSAHVENLCRGPRLSLTHGALH